MAHSNFGQDITNGKKESIKKRANPDIKIMPGSARASNTVFSLRYLTIITFLTWLNVLVWILTKYIPVDRCLPPFN
jgi:hypothetical protein